VAKVIATVGRRVTPVPQPPTPGSPPRRCPDMSKATRLLGYQAKTTLEEGLEKTYAWYRARVFEPNHAG
jgi:nucleoside-diphosphate-sugar epimerase